MRPRRTPLVALGACALTLLSAPPALAQVSLDPTVTPVRNTGGWVYGLAVLVFALGLLVLLGTGLAYFRYAPRFAREEVERPRVEPVVPGEAAPRRIVEVRELEPIAVAPPAVPAAPSPAAASATRQARPAAAPPPAALAASAPATPAPAPAPAPAPVAVPGPEAPAAGPVAAAAPPSPTVEAAPRERHEVALDQETYERTLEELLAKGTDRRVAEGQARRAAMIAARKKAGA